MQRKLVSFDVFETIEKKSLTNASNELVEAMDILGKALDVNLDGVRCYDERSVVYECADGTFVKASYAISDKNINFTNIEEIVIDEETETNSRKSNIRDMVDALTENENEKAEMAWDKLTVMLERVMKRGRAKKSMVDMHDDNFKKAGKMCEASGMVFVRHGTKDIKKAMAAKRGWAKRRPKEPAVRARMKGRLEMLRANRKKLAPLGAKAKQLRKGGVSARAYFTRTSKKKVNEWVSALDNFYGYINSNLINESVVSRSDSGDVVSVLVPVKNVRLEGKVINLKMDVLTAKVKILREQARQVVTTSDFAKAVSQLKRSNNISDSENIDETLSKIVSTWPSLIALSESEMAKAVSDALKFAGESNWDDQTAVWLSEAILRNSFDAAPDKANVILQLSDTEKSGQEDAYLDFQARVGDFYKKIDENLNAEADLTASLYNAISDISRMAEDVQDNDVKSDATMLLNELESMLSGKTLIDIQLAEAAAEWLALFLETNLDTDNGWSYLTDLETTENGDGAGPMRHSKFSYTPTEVDEFGRPLQIGQDTMNLTDKDGEAHGWGNKAPAGDVWDNSESGLRNPFLPKSIKYVGPKNEPNDVDSSDAFGTEDVGGKTWPSDVNPYLPRNMKPARPDMNEKDQWSK